MSAEPTTAPTLFQAQTPAGIITDASRYAEALADVIRSKKLYKTIGGRNHVLVEGWTLLGSMLGVYPVCEWTRPIHGPYGSDDVVGWEARVEARTRAGEVVGAAEVECLYSERNWKDRDDYALRSMAQTRAVSKALRLPLGFIISLAGYEATPADEMPVVEAEVVS